MWWPFSPSTNTTEKFSKTKDLPAPLQNAADTIPAPMQQELSRDEQASLEFAELLKEIEVESSRSPGERSQSKSEGKAEFSIPGNISADALYPKELNCRSAFDYAMFCQSFGGQFVNVYRYGEFRSCKNHWADFWLCMRTKNWDEQERAKAIQDHFRTKAIKYKTGPSSEDVWEVRMEPVKGAFQESLEELEAKIEEWKRANPGVPDPYDQ